MTADSTDATTTEAEGEDSPVVAKLRKQAASDAARIKELEGELGTVSRDKAFDDAGIPKGGPATFFRKAYDGDLTPEAIREAAVAGQIVSESTEGAAAATGPSAEELAAIARTSQATTTQAPQSPPDLAARLREAGKDGLGDKAAVMEIMAQMGPLSDDF